MAFVQLNESDDQTSTNGHHEHMTDFKVQRSASGYVSHRHAYFSSQPTCQLCGPDRRPSFSIASMIFTGAGSEQKVYPVASEPNRIYQPVEGVAMGDTAEDVELASDDYSSNSTSNSSDRSSSVWIPAVREMTVGQFGPLPSSHYKYTTTQRSDETTTGHYLPSPVTITGGRVFSDRSLMLDEFSVSTQKMYRSKFRHSLPKTFSAPPTMTISDFAAGVDGSSMSDDESMRKRTFDQQSKTLPPCHSHAHSAFGKQPSSILLHPFKPSTSRRYGSTPQLDKDAKSNQKKQLLIQTRESSFKSYLGVEKAKDYMTNDSVTRVMRAVESDHLVQTDPELNKLRRTLLIKRAKDQKFGFALQTYLLNDTDNKYRRVTYVDYVDWEGPACAAGLQAGDIILSINGQDVQKCEHNYIITKISWVQSLRVVVLFQNVAAKIDLWCRKLRLENLLADKKFELSLVQQDERRILRRSWAGNKCGYKKIFKKRQSYREIGGRDLNEYLTHCHTRSSGVSTKMEHKIEEGSSNNRKSVSPSLEVPTTRHYRSPSDAVWLNPATFDDVPVDTTVDHPSDDGADDKPRDFVDLENRFNDSFGREMGLRRHFSSPDIGLLDEQTLSEVANNFFHEWPTVCKIDVEWTKNVAKSNDVTIASSVSN